MNKADLINAIAKKTGFSKDASKKAIDAIVKITSQRLADHEEVRFVGFGVFKVKERKARMIYSPGTRRAVRIEAATIPVFKPSTALKATVSGK